MRRKAFIGLVKRGPTFPGGKVASDEDEQCRFKEWLRTWTPYSPAFLAERLAVRERTALELLAWGIEEVLEPVRLRLISEGRDPDEVRKATRPGSPALGAESWSLVVKYALRHLERIRGRLAVRGFEDRVTRQRQARLATKARESRRGEDWRVEARRLNASHEKHYPELSLRARARFIAKSVKRAPRTVEDYLRSLY